MSAMHIAAENGHVKILDLLITRGAVVSKDHRNNSPLHHAAANGYTKSITLLLNVHCYLMNATNSDGQTALHLSAKNSHTSAVSLLLSCKAKIVKDRKKMTFFDHVLETKSTDVAQSVIEHPRWEEIMSQSSEIYGQPVLGLVKELPDVCMTLMDRCATTSKDDPKSKKYWIEYNFRYLQNSVSESGEIERKPMDVLNEMVKYGRVDCLSHPLTINYLLMKWMAYGLRLSLTNFFIYILYVCCLSAFALNYKSKDLNTTLSEESETEKHGFYFIGILILVYSFINIICGIVQIFQQGSSYLVHGSLMLEFILHFCTVIFIIPFMEERKFYSYQWEAGIIAIFIAWFNCLLYLQSFESTGIYVVMFLEILMTLIKVFLVFFTLFVAFGFAFYLSMCAEPNEVYKEILPSILKSLMMMLELDYTDTFHTMFLRRKIPYKVIYVILIMYVILMPFLLMNLMIGLAVGDIESIQKNAGLKRLTMQVSNHTSIERVLPTRLLKRFDKETFKVYPNEKGKYFQSIMKESLSSGTFQNIEISAEKMDWEMRKQNQKLKSIQSMMENQQEMIRLITQKMEICTDADFVDEGDNFTECMGTALNSGNMIKRWKSFVEKVAK